MCLEYFPDIAQSKLLKEAANPLGFSLSCLPSSLTTACTETTHICVTLTLIALALIPEKFIFLLYYFYYLFGLFFLLCTIVFPKSWHTVDWTRNKT